MPLIQYSTNVPTVSAIADQWLHSCQGIVVRLRCRYVVDTSHRLQIKSFVNIISYLSIAFPLSMKTKYDGLNTSGKFQIDECFFDVLLAADLRVSLAMGPSTKCQSDFS